MDEAVARLPTVYAEFLALRGEGLADTAIAERLGLPLESLPLLAQLAQEKLAGLPPDPGTQGVPAESRAR